MKVVVTGSRGKVGRAAVQPFVDAGHDVLGVDLVRPGVRHRRRRARPLRDGRPDRRRAGLRGRRRRRRVVHVAAIPQPTGNPPHVVFQTNLMSTFNLIEAAVRFGVKRFVNVSSESIVGNFFPERPFLPDYVPIDEEHPLYPQDPYALSKAFGEQLMDAAVRRSDMRAISIRPSTVHNEDNYECEPRPAGARRRRAQRELRSYIDVYDLADALVLAAESDLPGSRGVLHRRSRQRRRARLRRDPARVYGDASSCATSTGSTRRASRSRRPRRLLGWTPKRSWRDYLDTDGRALPRR